MGLGRQFAAFAGVQLVEQGAADLVGRQVESDAPTLDADDAGEIAECQVDGVQAGNQRRAARLGFVDQQADGVQGQRRVEGGYRFVGQDQVGLLVEHAGDADALQLAAGELVATGEQLVGQVDTVECCPRPNDIERVKQGGQRFPRRPLAELACQHAGNDALPSGKGRRLVHCANAAAQGSGSTGRQWCAEDSGLPGSGRQRGAEHREQAGLAGTGRPDQGDALALISLQPDVG